MQQHPLLRCAVFLSLFSVLTTFAAAQRGGGPAPPRSAQDVLSEIKEKGDHSPDHLFALLGQMRDEAGLAALQKATDQVRRVHKVRAVYRAFAHFQGAGELEGQAISWLVGRANKGPIAAQRAAAGGLTHMGEPAHGELATLLRTHKDATLRATVLGPLVPGMGAALKAADLPLIVDNYQVPRTGDRKTAVEVLRAYSDKASLKVFEARLADKRFPRLMKTAIIEAVAPLPGAPVDRLLDLGLEVKDPAVQFAALQALQGREGSPNTRKLKKLTKSTDAAVRRLALVALAQGSIGDPDFQQDLLKWARDKDSAVRQGAAVGLALWRASEAVEALHILLADPEYAVRAEALQQVGNLHRKASIPTLITRLGAEQGRLSVDVASVLRLMTGLDYGRTPARWRAWWASEGEAFQLPSYEEALRIERQRNRRAAEGRTATSFYGLQVVSDRVCFVLDISGSMQGANLTAAKRELSAALDKYPEGDQFNIVFYSSDVFPWQDGLLEMNKRNRKASLAYVDRQNAGGGTALFDALEVAFEDSLIDTIFLLSDGNPTAGRITDPNQIRAEVKRWNSARKVRINCISLGMDSPLLRNLAADSDGQYTQVR
jgi:Mg-chelatase subunit ChlD